MCLTSALDITKSVNPPRAVFLDFPLGHTTGKVNNSDLQFEILCQTMEAFTTISASGSIKMLNFQWASDDLWKQEVEKEGEDRTERYDTPQYQKEEDRQMAESNRLNL